MRDAAVVERNTAPMAKIVPILLFIEKNMPGMLSHTMGKMLYPSIDATDDNVINFWDSLTLVHMSFIRKYMKKIVITLKP